MQGRYDISVVVTAHHEGRLAHHAMRGLFRSRDHASETGLQVEMAVVMDRPDQATRSYFDGYRDRVLLLETDFGDPGLARNSCMDKIGGEYVGWLDADNLPGQNWLHAAWAFLREAGGEVVAHPEYMVVFEAEELVFRQISMDDPGFSVTRLMEYNYWDTVCLARRGIFERFPYAGTSAGKGFGFEDWHWNCETIAHGVRHCVVPETVHFQRSKRGGSQRTQSRRAVELIRPNTLFEPEVYARAVRRYG